jgi:hypothetical protein
MLPLSLGARWTKIHKYELGRVIGITDTFRGQERQKAIIAKLSCVCGGGGVPT